MPQFLLSTTAFNQVSIRKSDCDTWLHTYIYLDVNTHFVKGHVAGKYHQRISVEGQGW